MNYTLLNILLVGSFLLAFNILLDMTGGLDLPGQYAIASLLLVEGFTMVKALVFPQVAARVYNKLMAS